MTTTPTSCAADLPEALRVPLDSLHADAGYLCGRLLNGSLTQEQVVESIHRRIDAAKLAALAAGQATAAQSGLTDAYVGAREDLSIWKRRALKAEATVRNFVREANSPTFMGDPASDECHHGDAYIVNDCLRCGAPVCCGKCCAAEATPSPQAAESAHEVRVPLDSLHADAGYLCGRLRDGSLPYARLTEIIRERIDAASPTAQAAGNVPAISDFPPLPDIDLRDVGTKPQDVKDFLNGYATEYARLALAARAPADSVLEDAARYRWLREGNDAKHGAAWHVAVNLYGCEWDAAIDAARKQGEKK